MIYAKLFWSFLQVGLFSIGGGYAAMPLIQSQVVELNQWLTMDEFSDLITIAEMTPGPIAINSATFVGIRIAGPVGAIVATLGSIFPALIIVSLLAYIYFRYKTMNTLQSVLRSLRPAVVSLIAAAGISIFLQAVFESRSINPDTFHPVSLVLFLVAFIVLRKWKCSPILVMVLCGIANLAVSLLCL